VNTEEEKLLLYKSIALKMIGQYGKEEAYSRIKEAIQIVDTFTKCNEPVGNVFGILGSIASIILQSECLDKEEITNSTWSEMLENEDVKVTFIIEPKSRNLDKVLHGIAKKSQRAYLDFATDMGDKHSWFVSKKVNADV